MIFKTKYFIPRQHLHLYTKDRIKEQSVKQMIDSIVENSTMQEIDDSDPKIATFETKIAFMDISDYNLALNQLLHIVRLFPELTGVKELINRM